MSWQPGIPRQLADVSAWKGRVDRGETRRKFFEKEHGWDEALERYNRSKADNYEVNALLDHRHVESKKAQLFYQTPEVQLLPIDPQIAEVPTEQILPFRQKVLNHKLGPDGDNVKAEIHEALFDAIAPSGFLVTNIGYENVTVKVKTQRPPMFNPLGPPEEVELDVPIWEHCFWVRVSPKKLIIPDDFKNTKYDRAPFLGLGPLTMPLSKAKRRWTLPDDFSGSTQHDNAVFKHGDEQAAAASDPLVEYTTVWYRAHIYDDDVVHPELFRELTLVKGLDYGIVRDSPYQTLGPDGRLTDDSMIGNPIHIGTLRDLSDSAYVKSDLAVGEQLSNEVNQFRTSQVRGRRKRSPIVLVVDALGQEKITQIGKNEGPIPVPQEYIDSGGQQRAVAVVSPGNEPRDNYTAQDYMERDFDRALGTSANQQGQFSKQKRTATEARIVQGNSDARAEAERDRLREYYMAGVRKYDCVLQRFMTQAELQKILGQQGAMLWQQWKAFPGKYGYKILPDSGIHVDAVQFRAEVMELYNKTRQDPRVNPDDLLKLVARAYNRDPNTFIAPPVDKTTEPPSASISFKGEDMLNKPMSLLLLDLCANGGIKLNEQTIQAFAEMHEQQEAQAALGIVGVDEQPGHGGIQPQAEPITKHSKQRTGGVQGVGRTAA